MPIKAIKEYLEENFKEEQAREKPLISEAEIVQLAWAVRPAGGHTPEKAIVDKERFDLIEVRRLLSRFYCLELLCQGETSFDKFVAIQDDKNQFLPRLNQDQYAALTHKFKNVDQLTIDALRVSTLVTAFPLSPKAKESADKVLGKNNYPFDSVEFLAATFKDINQTKEIYPCVKALFEKYNNKTDQDRLIKLLQSALSSRRHYRHMLYTEGNETMYHGLIDAIRDNTLDKEAYHFWKLHWTVNIAGFRGNESVKGSIYLTSNTFTAIQALEEQLDRIAQEPDLQASTILDQYLLKRAGFLKLERYKELTTDHTKILAHIGAMMRMFHPVEGKNLVIAFQFLPKKIIDILSKAYFEAQDKQKPTPTYVPAFFQNAKDQLTKLLSKEIIFQILDELSKVEASLSNQDGVILEVNNIQIKNMLVSAVMVAACLPLYLAALSEYNQKRAQGEFANGEPLSFRVCAGKTSIEEIFPKITASNGWKLYESFEPQVSANGEVSFVPKKLELIEDVIAQNQAVYLPGMQAAKDAAVVAKPPSPPRKDDKEKLSFGK